MPDNSVVKVFGEPIEIVVPSRDAGYRACGGIQTSPPGGGPPPHKHLREEETFTVLDGEFEVLQRDGWVRMSAGSVYCSLRGTWHGFRNITSAPARMLFLTNSGGLDDYFEEISSLELPGDMQRLADISDRYGYYFQTPEDRPDG